MNLYTKLILCWPALAAIHAPTHLGILLIKFIKTLLGIWLHSSCNAVSNSLTFLGKVERFLMRLSSSDHKCLIGLSFLSINQFRRFSLCRSVSKGLDVGMREKNLISP